MNLELNLVWDFSVCVSSFIVCGFVFVLGLFFFFPPRHLHLLAVDPFT